MAIGLAALSFASPSYPQLPCSLTVRGPTGSAIGRLAPDGRVRDASGALLGRLDDGKVRSASGSLIGRIDPDGKVRDASGSSIGRIDSDGRLRNRSGAAVGRVDANGTVRNASGAARGRFDGYLPACRLAAAAYLFFFEPLHSR